MSAVRDPWRATEQSAWTDGWHPSAKPVDRDLMRRRPLLVARSLDEHRNNPLVSGASLLLTEVVGCLQWRSRAKDPEVRRIVQERWDDWCQQAGSDGVSSLQELDYQHTGSACQCGDVLTLLPQVNWVAEGENPLRVDLVDSLRIASPGDDQIREGYRVDNGVLVGPDRRTMGYYVAKEGRALYSRALEDFVYFPRDRSGRVNARLFRRPNPLRRPGQHREVPPVAAALLNFHDIYLHQKASLRGAVAKSKLNFITKAPDPEQLARAWQRTNNEADPKVQAAMASCLSRSQSVLEDASGLNMAYGEDFEILSNQHTDPNYGSFVLWNLKFIAAAYGMPHEVLWNLWGEANYSRARILIMRAKSIAPTWHAAKMREFHVPINTTWFQYEAILGKIPGVAAPEQLTRDITAGEWYCPPPESMDPKTDLEAAALRLKLGQRSEIDIAAQDGYDADEVDAERIAFRARRKQRMADARLTEDDMRVGDAPAAKGRPANEEADDEKTPAKPKEDAE